MISINNESFACYVRHGPCHMGTLGLLLYTCILYSTVLYTVSLLLQHKKRTIPNVVLSYYAVQCREVPSVRQVPWYKFCRFLS